MVAMSPQAGRNVMIVSSVGIDIKERIGSFQSECNQIYQRSFLRFQAQRHIVTTHRHDCFLTDDVGIKIFI